MTEPREDAPAPCSRSSTADGAGRDVFVNPYGAEVLGSLDPDATCPGIANTIHGELMRGPWGDHVIELGACWAVVMALTGYYLFVRGWRARRRRRRRAPGRRGCARGTASSAPWSGSGC